MQDLNDMLYFAEVVDRGSFAAAGRALGIPKSRLSRRVAELEGRLGVRLLQRSTRKLSLTAVGEQYHRHCLAMRDNAQAADEVVAQAQTEPRGLVRVACPVTLAQTTLAPVFPAFLARYPQVQLDLRVSNRAVDLIEEGFDVALRVRPSLDDSGSLVIKNFGASQSWVVASPKQVARQGQPTSPAELARMDTVAMSAQDGKGAWHLLGPGGEGLTLEHRPRLVADDLLTLQWAARAGIGATTLPDYMCRDDVQAGRLLRLLPEWALRPMIFHAVFPSRRGLVPAVRQFLDFLGEQVKGPGLWPD